MCHLAFLYLCINKEEGHWRSVTLTAFSRFCACSSLAPEASLCPRVRCHPAFCALASTTLLLPMPMVAFPASSTQETRPLDLEKKGFIPPFGGLGMAAGG